jgi:hypothetical protein
LPSVAFTTYALEELPAWLIARVRVLFTLASEAPAGTRSRPAASRVRTARRIKKSNTVPARAERFAGSSAILEYAWERS